MKNQEEWRRDVDFRQRNIVFPDTAANEARFWQNIIAGKQKLTLVQIVGVALFIFTLIGVIVSSIAMRITEAHVQGSLVERVIGSVGDWIVLTAIAVGVLVIGHIVSNRTKSRSMPPIPCRTNNEMRCPQCNRGIPFDRRVYRKDFFCGRCGARLLVSEAYSGERRR